MKIQDYNLATGTMTRINWLQEEIDKFSDQSHIRIIFELNGYDSKNHRLPPELKEEVFRLAAKVKSFYVSEKEKIEKELDSL